MFSPSHGSEVSRPGRYQPGGEIKNDGSYLAGREKGLLGVNMAGCLEGKAGGQGLCPRRVSFPSDPKSLHFRASILWVQLLSASWRT